jgi:hypothetical protein
MGKCGGERKMAGLFTKVRPPHPGSVAAGAGALTALGTVEIAEPDAGQQRAAGQRLAPPDSASSARASSSRSEPSGPSTCRRAAPVSAGTSAASRC